MMLMRAEAAAVVVLAVAADGQIEFVGVEILVAGAAVLRTCGHG